MEDFFEDAQGWQTLSSYSGSSNTTIHILQRHSRLTTLSTLTPDLFCVKAIALVPPASTKFISNKSISFKYKDYEQIKTEIKALEKLRNESHIVELYQVIAEHEGASHVKEFFRSFLKEKDCKGKYIGLVMQYCPLGSLKDFLLANPKLEQKQIVRLALEISACLYCLEKNSILHRDLRTTNLLLTQEKGLKLTDFDSSYMKGFSNINDVAVSIQKQTSSPELIALMDMDLAEKEELSEQELYSFQSQCDIYSFGTVMFEMITGEEFKKEKVSSLNETEFQLYLLTQKMLTPSPSQRIKLAAIEKQLLKLAETFDINVPVHQQKQSNHLLSLNLPAQMFFHPSTITKSQSNSISLSDWSLEDSPLPLYRKPVEHPDIHYIDSSVNPRFNKTYTIQI